ncbi:hypothetical protein KCT31_000998 [Enterococcus faecalis]|nr:hypothetical protein [Enterococcus faecalis]
MKRNFFQVTFNIILFLILSSIVGFFLNIVFTFTNSSNEINNANTVTFALFNDNFTTTFRVYIYKLTLLTSCISLILIIIEVVNRIRKDSLINYIKSIYQTFRMRYFLRQYQSNSSKPTDIMKTNHSNPILNSFNRSASKCIVDVHKEKTIVLLKVPNTQQAQKLLEERLESIQKEITSRHPHYYFSAPNRIGNQLWFIGTRR